MHVLQCPFTYFSKPHTKREYTFIELFFLPCVLAARPLRLFVCLFVCLFKPVDRNQGKETKKLLRIKSQIGNVKVTRLDDTILC